MSQRIANWADSFTYSASGVHRPRSVAEVQLLVSGSTRVKAIGTRHSFSRIADTEGDLVCLEKMCGISVEGASVTVEAGVTFGQLCWHLHGMGLALHNLASLPHISVVGGCATATHGSGDKNGNLATAVRGLEFVAADGSLVSFSENVDGVAVNLGALGVVVRMTLAVVPAFEMRQDVYEDLPLEALRGRFDEATSAGYSVSLFTDWRQSVFNQVWLKRLSGTRSLPDFFGAKMAAENRHPINGVAASNCTAQMGVPGPWHERLPHFRMEYTPSSGDEIQSEYLIPRKHAWDALLAIDRIRDRVSPILHVSEIRTIAADRLWMSPCYEQDCVSIHFTWHKNPAAVLALLPVIEDLLEPFEARPHWGKLFTMPAERVQALYPRLPEFRRLVETYDPRGKFRNPFLDEYLF